MNHQATRSGSDLRVPRRAKTLGADGRSDERPLASWRSLNAYVLLGDPGAGKSEALRQEAEESGGTYVTARDFITLGAEPRGNDPILFIDGLDEMRAGAVNGRVPLDAIRAGLKARGYPRFRLSCREHDWRAQTDLPALVQVAPGGAVQELHLEPLSREEQRCLLTARSDEIGSADAFLEKAEQLGLAPLFGNPLLLDLTVRAVATLGDWPKTRYAVYDLACRQLAHEHSPGHLEAAPLQPGDIDNLLDDAGVLCAVLLLSGKAAISRAQVPSAASVAWHALPAELQLHDPARALASKVFASSADESTPRHRSIAEYLGGRAIARRLHEGLPLDRLLALMQGGDGGVVEPLRGLLGWLATHDASNRARLIRVDPLAAILNGDVAMFSTDDKLGLLEALRDEARRNEWFRRQQWVSYPYAPLATAEMAGALGEVLANLSTDASHQALVDCVLDALNHGESLPALRPGLERWIENDSAWLTNRFAAYDAWVRCGGIEAEKARAWLDRLSSGDLKDHDARLAGHLLTSLYPAHVGPSEVLRYWPREGAVRLNSSVPFFWYHSLTRQSRPDDFPVLADAWLQLHPQGRGPRYDSELARLGTSILDNALERAGDRVPDAHLYEWLGIGIDEHGFSKLDREAGGTRIAEWLTKRPHRLKNIVSLGWLATQPDAKSGRRYFWEAEQRLHGARLPSDWLYWLLEQASLAPNDELARYCFSRVALTAVDPPAGLDLPSMEEIEDWVAANAQRWPQGSEWLLAAWSSQLEDNWRSDDYRRRRKHEAEGLAKKEARRKALEPHLDSLLSGTASPHLLHQLAGAHEQRFYDIHGSTPEERVQDFLASDEATARAAIAALTRVLSRTDLPSAGDVLDTDAKGKYHFIRPAALLAARLVCEQRPEAVDSWSDSLLSSLVAFWLTDGIGETPTWYKRAAELRPALVAPLLVRQTLPRLRRKGQMFVTGLWTLARDPTQSELARLALPGLLEGFPHRASEAARRELNGSLLAALHLLDSDIAADIVRRKIDQPSLDPAQRLCWMAADIPYRPDAMDRVMKFVGRNERRAVALGVALHEQGSLERALKGLPPEQVSQLIELLAPITKPERPAGAHWVGPAENRSDIVRALVNHLAADTQHQTAAELQRLLEVPRLKSWREHLRYSVTSQRAAAREAHFAHPSPERAALTLANRAPANRSDLRALVLDHLRDIERTLRGADTFELRFFWNEVGDRPTPKHEEDCRDLLLARLRDRLSPLGVAVVPERRAADEKRSDLRAEFIAGGEQLAIPVEVKKEDNDRLWLAWRDQLQALYANDPAADGYGIYLALWFGHKPRPSPDGAKPIDAADLERRLIELVPLADRSRIAIRVIDLSLPVKGAAPTGATPAPKAQKVARGEKNS